MMDLSSSELLTALEFTVLEDITAMVEVHQEKSSGYYWFLYWEVHNVNTGWYSESSIVERRFESDLYETIGECVSEAIDLVDSAIRQVSIKPL